MGCFFFWDTLNKKMIKKPLGRHRLRLPALTECSLMARETGVLSYVESYQRLKKKQEKKNQLKNKIKQKQKSKQTNKQK